MAAQTYRNLVERENGLLEEVEQERRRSLGDAERALARIERRERRGVEDSVGRCSIALLRGHLLSALGRHQQALKAFGVGIERGRAEGWERVITICLCATAAVEVRMALYEEAHRSLESALAIALRRQDRRLEAGCRVQLADVYRRLGDLAGAHSQVDLTMTLAEQERDPALQVGALNMRGTVLAALGLWAEAVEVQHGALTIAEEHTLLDERLTLLGNLALSTRRWGRHEESERHYGALLESAKKANRTGSMGVAWLGIGDLRAEERRHDEAEEAYREALGIFSALNIRNDAVRAMCGVAEMHRMRGNRAGALEMMERAWEEGAGIASPALHAMLRGELSRLHRSMAAGYEGDPSRAAEHYHIALDHAEACMGLHATLRSAEVQRTVLAAAMRDRISQLERALEQEHQSLMVHAAQIVEKNTAIGELLEMLRELRRGKAGDIHSALPELERRVAAAMRSGEHWEGFERQFRAVHPEFIALLSRLHPSLTATERRVCVLLRMTLSTKDISSLIGVSTESVEKYRQRIRRKLELAQQENLATYLTSL